jgi:putative transposase
MRIIDEEYTKYPFYGSRKMASVLRDHGYCVNRKRAQRLMRIMGLEAIYQKPKTTIASREHKKYPYLLKGLSIEEPNFVWSSDITYIRMENGFVFLTAVIDWFSRYVIAWRLSNTLDSLFCVEALQESLKLAKPVIFNTDQGVQYTAKGFTETLEGNGIQVSMDGKGRAIDNIFIERLWRSLKYELVYLKDYKTIPQLYESLNEYFHFYNYIRPHHSLGYRRPFEIHFRR